MQHWCSLEAIPSQFFPLLIVLRKIHVFIFNHQTKAQKYTAKDKFSEVQTLSSCEITEYRLYIYTYIYTDSICIRYIKYCH